MLVQKENLLFKYVKKIRNYEHFEKILQQQDLVFDYRPFKIEKLAPQQALQKYTDLQKGYDYFYERYYFTKEIKFLEEKWHEQEKRLYVWFMVIYCYFFEKEVSLLTPPVHYRHHINFQAISQLFFDKSSFFLEFQFLNLFKVVDKIIWTEEEESLLTNAVKKYGKTNWTRISKEIFGVSERKKFIPSKYCRQRWQNHLDQSKVKGNWTPQEDMIIISSVLDPEIGKKWARMKSLLKDRRTEHMIKNRYHSLITKFRSHRFDKQRDIAQKIMNQLQYDLKDQQQSEPFQGVEDKNLEKRKSKQIDLKEQNISDQESSHIQQQIQILFENEVPEEMIPQVIKEEEVNIKTIQIPDPICIKNVEVQKDEDVGIKIPLKKDNKKPEQNEQEEEENVFPFNNYSYDDQLRNMSFYSFQNNPMFFYPYVTYGTTVSTVPTTESCNFQQQNNGYFQPQEY